jgi:hypothetical protein
LLTSSTRTRPLVLLAQNQMHRTEFWLSLSSMTDRLADILDARLAELRGEGFEIRRIFASPADIEQLFRELGDAAILLDCDLAQDKAWYGQYELAPAEAEGTMIMYCRGEECWINGLVRPDAPVETLRAAS